MTPRRHAPIADANAHTRRNRPHYPAHMSLRIAFIGAGSVGFTRKLVKDVLLVPELRDTHFALHDINADNLDRVARLLQKEVDANKLPAKISSHLDRRAALDGAKYVVNATRIGGLDAFATDIDIPLAYGIDQCVGDTLCAGGIMYGQRNVPQVLAFQKDMAELCDTSGGDGRALFLNYANPMAINTWAALDAYDRGEGINTVGLCHGVQHGHQQIAQVLGVDTDEPGWQDRVQIICSGINHQTWYTHVWLDGRRVAPEELIRGFEAHPTFSEDEKVRIDVMKRFGCYSTESNGHLSEYLPWYRKRPERINDWIGDRDWIHGETGGYLRVCSESQDWFKTDFPKWLDEAGTPIDTWQRSHEHGSFIIEALETGRTYRGHFNRRNGGCIKNLPPDCVIEAPGYVDRTGMHMAEGLGLPAACAATCNVSIQVQRMAKDAAVNADVTLLKQAILHDPLTGAMLEPEEVWQMTDEMLVAQRQWLPQFDAAGECDAAADRLKQAEAEGRRVEKKDWAGAARKRIKSVEQLREERDAATRRKGDAVVAAGA